MSTESLEGKGDFRKGVWTIVRRLKRELWIQILMLDDDVRYGICVF